MKSTNSTSEAILDVAQDLIVAGGYNGFSYADISDAIGIRKASIHHHFPTKAALVTVLLDRYRSQAEAGLKSLSEQVPDPVARLESYVAYWHRCIVDSAPSFCVCALLASEMQMLPDEVAARVQAYFKSLAEWLSSALRAGAEQDLFRLTNLPEQEAQVLMASVHGVMLSARAFGDPDLFLAVVNPQLAKLRAPRA